MVRAKFCCWPSALEMPKSPSLTMPWLQQKMLLAFRSRCMIPCREHAQDLPHMCQTRLVQGKC